MPERIRKRDIDRERERLRANIDRYPALALLLEGLPDDYDPEADGSISKEPRPKDEPPDDK